MSTPASPLSPLTIGGARRLSARRRGSLAAPDPFGTFPDADRGMTSTLHIIKAPPVAAAHDTEDRARRRTGNGNGAHARSHSGGSTGARISFALAGFSPISPQREPMSGPRSASVEHARPASPLSTRPMAPRSNSFTTLSTTSHTPLTPMQVYDLAQQCNYPHSRPSTPGGNVIPSTPITFTPLPDGHHLPFVDRPSEVRELMTTPLTSKLFLLLAQTFPSTLPPGDDADPTSWTYSQLEHWLTKIGRDQADDAVWVQKARACIFARSELIWERIKGALGVPPELDGLHDGTDKQNGSDADVLGVEGRLESGEDFTESFGDAWVEPIIASPAASSPIARSPTGSFRRSPSLTRQSLSRMEDISEDAPEPGAGPPPAPAVHGLRVVTSPTEPPARRLSAPSPTSANSFFHPHVPYDAAAERGPGHPLFPTSFAYLALGPTLEANNPSLRSPTVPPASAYPLSHSTSRPRRQVASWADGWDPQKQEYAVSVDSGSSRRSVPVE